MPNKPTIYVTNFASRKPPFRGPGRVFRIMAKPRPWEFGDGWVERLTPHAQDLDDVQHERITAREYERRCRRIFNRADVRPATLVARSNKRANPSTWPVEDGDTLCCACSKAKAAEGKCHRVWSAEYLARAGWRVVLDGELLEVMT